MNQDNQDVSRNCRYRLSVEDYNLKQRWNNGNFQCGVCTALL